MSDDILNLIQREIERALAGRYNKRYGLVTSYDPERHLAKVTLQPEGQESGWLVIKTSHIGNGWGMAVGLQIGDQVELMPQEGDLETLAITGVVHSEQDKPPVVQSGEMLLQHQMGHKVKLSKDGGLSVVDATGLETLHKGGKVMVGGASANKAVLLVGGTPSTQLFTTT